MLEESVTSFKKCEHKTNLQSVLDWEQEPVSRNKGALLSSKDKPMPEDLEGGWWW